MLEKCGRRAWMPPFLTTTHTYVAAMLPPFCLFQNIEMPEQIA